ncbi:DUF992 domain-containing protein [Mesorhizobium sp. RP14(2022)]|jgi:hypothetical protein|uniref:DUF992 domain-containing protein n=1 Tax=Mesorhizobium liriopis TaxID=2953882 RepID=A0ABT1C6E9_9HYPH|nr:DUF992 domain-containing protein [Mesorhizobium liriopis]MCO6049756.1 DUF992 domain-containing protein [Mesorhizobium liriopis]
MKKTLSALAILGASLFAATPATHAAGLELGILDCAVDGGLGYVVGSHKGLTCTFRPYDKAYGPEIYTGRIGKLGIDLGITHQSSISWAVLAAHGGEYGPGSLVGNYLGASADASIVTGGGANLLVGGFKRSLTLQPLSVQTQTGLNAAVAVTKLELYQETVK